MGVRWVAGLVAAVVLVGCSGRANTAEIEAWVKDSVTDYARTDDRLAEYRLQVMGVDLIHKSGNEYEGYVTLRTIRAEDHEVGVEVIYDGDQGKWEIDRADLLWLVSEDVPPPYQP